MTAPAEDALAPDGRPMVGPFDRAGWRAWLIANHASSSGVHLVSWRRPSGRTSVAYEAAVEEALCVGWIDSVAGRLDDDRALQWFSPRRPDSGWARSNKERVERLTAAGLMLPAGLAAIEEAKRNGTWTMLDDVENLVVPDDLAAALDAAPPARDHWDCLQSIAPAGHPGLARPGQAPRDPVEADRGYRGAGVAQRRPDTVPAARLDRREQSTPGHAPMTTPAGSARAAKLVADLRAAASALIAVLERIDHERWTHIPGASVWSVGKDAEHVAEATVYHQWIVRSTIGEKVSSRRPVLERRELTTAMTVQEAVDLIRRRSEEGAALISSLTDDQLAMPTKPPRARGQVLADTIALVLIDHYHGHRRDIELKLGDSLR